MNSDSFCVNIADLGTTQTSIRNAWKITCHLYMWHPGNGQVRICELLLDFKALHPGTPGFSHSLNSFLCFLVFRNDEGPGSLLGWQADANSATKQGRSTLQQAAHQAQPFSRGIRTVLLLMAVILQHLGCQKLMKTIFFDGIIYHPQLVVTCLSNSKDEFRAFWCVVGLTLRGHAYTQGHKNVVELLLARRADPNSKDEKGAAQTQMERAKLTGCHDLFCFLGSMTFRTQAASEGILCSMQVDARLIPWKNLEIPWNPWNVGMTCGCTWPHQCDLLPSSESGTPGNPIAFRGAEWLWRHGGGSAMWTKPFECEAWESLFWSHVFGCRCFWASFSCTPLL